MVTVRFFAAARAAAGTTETSLDAASLTELREFLGEKYGPELTRVLSISSYLVDGTRDGDLRDGAVVDVLPPFAGG
ncbi:thiamine biosynthesis protein ThiS [Actinorhabdospora filicis]|uniref:Thiamine biosynthesis protein ThiS n=2 Tax=Actinorhabdospora filicis TaxID=1785913 RepID=A0A9W6SK61_9ACTN|nr:thiamine biosynthesis protein ThiS [Actinorhabdospora filicis]